MKKNDTQFEQETGDLSKNVFQPDLQRVCQSDR